MNNTRIGFAIRIALTELKGGTKGFVLFLVCLAIGVAAIAAAGSMAAAFRSGLEGEQRLILGGDFNLAARQRMPTPEELAFFKARGEVSLAIDSRTMGQKGDVRRLIDVRAVDQAHPLEGQVVTAPAGPLQANLLQKDGIWGGVAEQALLDAFGLKVGDVLDLPYGQVRINAVLEKEPDALGRGFALSPRLMISNQALSSLNLAQPGSLFSSALRTKLKAGQNPERVKADFEAAFPDSVRNLRDKARSAEGFDRALGRVELFLSCVGFASLLAGGLGVAGAVRGHLETRRTSIAVLKTMGASAGDVRLAYGLQIGALAILGALLGVVIGAAAPLLVQVVYSDSLPIPIGADLHWRPLLAAAGIGLLCAFAFAAPPLGAARATPPSHLLRGGSANTKTPRFELIAAALGLFALVGLFAITSPNPTMAVWLAIGSGLGWLGFFGWGKLAQWGARKAPRPGGALGLGLAALGGPGSLAPAAAPALGLGLALLVALGQIQSNLVTQVRDTAPASAPSVAYTEIAEAEGEAFDRTFFAAAGAVKPQDYARTPVITARVITLNGVELDVEKVKPSERWIVEQEIGATWTAEKPSTAKLTAGQWWAKDYADPFAPQVSLEAEAADGIGAKVGDTLGVLVSGVEVQAQITSLREVDWAGFGANFALVFSPGAFEGAAFRHYAIARITKEQEARVTTALAKDFPAVGVVRVRDALAAAADLFESLAVAIQAIAAVALAAGIAAVTGALAAGARRRLYEAAILKAMGASRARIVAAFAIEQAAAGLVAALVGAVLGLGAAWAIVTQILEADWALNVSLVGTIVGAAVALFGLAGAGAGFAALGQPPSRVLAAAAEFK